MTPPSYNGYVSRAAYLEQVRQDILEAAERREYVGDVKEATAMREVAERLLEQVQEARRANR